MRRSWPPLEVDERRAYLHSKSRSPRHRQKRSRYAKAELAVPGA
jgi:hypothetical protein